MEGLIQKVHNLGFEWRDVPRQNPNHPILNAYRDGDTVKTSGNVAFYEGELKHPGKVGIDVLAPDAYESAVLAALNCLQAACSVVDPDRITGVKEVHVFVNGAPNFIEISKVADGASKFFVSLFGEVTHIRTAVSVQQLPLGASVEVEAVFSASN